MDVFGSLSAQGAMIQSLVCDSRRAAPGVAFFAYPGEATDGRRFIPEAVARGAAAVIWEAEGYAWDPAWAVPNVGVPGLKDAAGQLARTRAADVVLIAGKGHEDYQDIAGRRLPFSDAALAAQILSTWRRA